MIALLRALFRRPEPAITDARPVDAAALAQVHAAAFHHGWSEAEFERLLADKAVVCHVTRRGISGPILGFVMSRIVLGEAEVLMVAVDPGEQGRGTGGKLMARHLARLAALGVEHLFLEVEEGNEPALRLYRRAGFEQVGRREGYYVKPEGQASALILRRRLR